MKSYKISVPIRIIYSLSGVILVIYNAYRLFIIQNGNRYNLLNIALGFFLFLSLFFEIRLYENYFEYRIIIKIKDINIYGISEITNYLDDTLFLIKYNNGKDVFDKSAIIFLVKNRKELFLGIFNKNQYIKISDKAKKELL